MWIGADKGTHSDIEHRGSTFLVEISRKRHKYVYISDDGISSLKTTDEILEYYPLLINNYIYDYAIGSKYVYILWDSRAVPHHDQINYEDIHEYSNCEESIPIVWKIIQESWNLKK